MNFEGKRIYLSGAMSDKKDFNQSYFNDITKSLYYRGAHYVFNPAKYADIDHDKPYETYMLRDIHELTELYDDKPYYDCILMLPGYKDSYGAKVELLVAQTCGIEVLVYDE